MYTLAPSYLIQQGQCNPIPTRAFEHSQLLRQSSQPHRNTPVTRAYQRSFEVYNFNMEVLKGYQSKGEASVLQNFHSVFRKLVTSHWSSRGFKMRKIYALNCICVGFLVLNKFFLVHCSIKTKCMLCEGITAPNMDVPMAVLSTVCTAAHKASCHGLCRTLFLQLFSPVFFFYLIVFKDWSDNWYCSLLLVATAGAFAGLLVVCSCSFLTAKSF